MSVADIVGNLVDQIIDDIRGRKSLGDAWDEIDFATHIEIRTRWEELARSALASAQERQASNPGLVPQRLACE